MQRPKPMAPPTKGDDYARRWLETFGVFAGRPYIRSSDYELAQACEFQYFLRRRLGLMSVWDHSPALSYGTWFHAWAQGSLAADAAWTWRQQEIRTLGDMRAMSSEAIKKFLDREDKERRMAGTWWDAIKQVVITPGFGTLQDFLDQPHWQLLASELGLRIPHPRLRRCVLAIRLDRLYYHKGQNSLYILDWKTCDEPCETRLATCPMEFQTRHYLIVLKLVLETGLLQRRLGIPDDVKVGGMIHVAVQKPPITFGTKDRPYVDEEYTPTRGKNAGKTRIERRYVGEPSYDLYLERCLDWYLGRGPYLDQAAERRISPPVNISTTSGAYLLEKNMLALYDRDVVWLHSLGERRPMPDWFRQSSANLRRHGKLSPWAPFYLSPIRDWPDIIKSQGFIVGPRDGEFPWELVDDETVRPALIRPRILNQAARLLQAPGPIQYPVGHTGPRTNDRVDKRPGHVPRRVVASAAQATSTPSRPSAPQE